MGRGLEMTPRVGKATTTMILVCSLNGSSFLYAISLIFFSFIPASLQHVPKTYFLFLSLLFPHVLLHARPNIHD